VLIEPAEKSVEFGLQAALPPWANAPTVLLCARDAGTSTTAILCAEGTIIPQIG
jgi:hypothetical protein